MAQGLHAQVIIKASNIVKYFGTLTFPVQVREERSERVALSATRDELLSLIHLGKVIGVGSWKQIRHIRLNSPLPTSYLRPAPEGSDDPFHGGDSSRLHYDEDLGQGRHLTMLKRPAPDGAWRKWHPELTFSELRAGKMKPERASA